MNKREFLMRLRKGLCRMPKNEAEERLTFYAEMIDDRMEEGLSEEEVVSQIGEIDDIISQILSDPALSDTAKSKRRLRAWEICLLVLGSPVWLPLLVAVVAVILAFYVVLWSAVISLWAVEASLWGCAVGGIAGCVACVLSGNVVTGVAVAGVCLICAGLSVFMFYLCRVSGKGTVLIAKKFALGIKNRLTKEEAVK